MSQLDLAARRRDLHPAPELRRNRPLAAVARDGAASRRAARGAAARAQPAAGVGGLRAGVPASGRSAIRRCTAARKAVELVLKGHEPYPALAVDRHWTLLDAERGGGAAARRRGLRRCCKPPVNVLRLSLHPGGLAPRIANLAEWRAHLLERLRKQIEVTADPVLVGAAATSCAPIRRPAAASAAGAQSPTTPAWWCRCSLRPAAGVLSFLSTTTVFGTPVDVTLSEIALEVLLPGRSAPPPRPCSGSLHRLNGGALRRRDRYAIRPPPTQNGPSIRRETCMVSRRPPLYSGHRRAPFKPRRSG